MAAPKVGEGFSQARHGQVALWRRSRKLDAWTVLLEGRLPVHRAEAIVLPNRPPGLDLGTRSNGLARLDHAKLHHQAKVIPDSPVLDDPPVGQPPDMHHLNCRRDTRRMSGVLHGVRLEGLGNGGRRS